jgi:asparagine synthase (glutamine-hydrolysing)
MCGIVAIFGRRASPSVEAVHRALDSIHHRGPDGNGIWKSDEGTTILGHKRLSVLDLKTGDQPLANEDETLHVIVNGEFYGFEKIRETLEAQGHRFRTQSDSEIVLHLYEEYGYDCLHYLRGEFAFVLWDGNRNTLFAARDRFGMKPLFYSQSNGMLLFASEVKALHASGVEAGWNEGTLGQMLGMGIAASGGSHFRHVEVLPPGHYIVANRDSIASHQYWDFNFPREEELIVLTDQEYAEQFRSLLDESVRLRMRSDVPVACYLSGGIDSCSILSLMARHSSSPVRAFSLGFDDPALDESAHAQEMAKHVATGCEVIPVSQSDLADNFSEAMWHAETINFNTNSVAKFILSRAVQNAGYKVVLTGEGSDEIVAGYPHFRQDLFSSLGGGDVETLRSFREKNVASRGLLLSDGDDPKSPVLMERLGYAPAFLDATYAISRKVAPLVSNYTPIDRIFSSLLDTVNVADQLRGRHVVNQSLYLWNKSYLPGIILTVLGDRMEMAHSIEGRVPFLDHHLVEFTRTLPVGQKINGTVEKFVLREAMKPFLPASVYQRQKHPFLAPAVLTNRDTPLHRMMQDTLRGNALNRTPFINRKEVIAVLDSLPGLDPNIAAAWEAPLMMLFSTAVLAEKFQL